MLKIGETQKLIVEKTVPFGLYLKEADAPEGEHVLLPRNQVPEGTQVKDEMEVFLYKDSEDRPVATMKTPRLKLHEVGWLTVTDVNSIGAFLDWGLPRDLLLPYHEQPKKRVQKGQEVLAAIYLDKSSRLCATMNVYPYLSVQSPYKKDDQVQGTVYETSGNFGVFVAVDDKYSGLIPKKELVCELNPGDKVSVRVTNVRQDGKLDLSLRDKAYLQMGKDADAVLAEIEKRGGKLPFTDKADPEVIRREMHMSKNEFKRAVGNLLKAGKVMIGSSEIALKK